MIVTFNSPNQDENWTAKSLSSLIAKRQRSGDDVKYLIAPTPIDTNANDDDSNQSCTAARNRPKQPKNHLMANRRALKEKQIKIKDAATERQAQEIQRLKRRDQKKNKLYGKVRSRVFDQCATSESPISSPGDHASSMIAASHSTCNDSTSGQSEQNFHIAFGKKVPISAPVPQPSTSQDTVASGVRHKSFGKVPTYITERRAMRQQREEELRIAQMNAPPEPGLVVMEESERLETLRLLEENEQEAKQALRNIPFSMNELKADRLRETIYSRLKEIEDTKRIFSREKVFVALSDG